MALGDPSLRRELDGVSNVFVLVPTMGSGSEEACMRLSHVAPPEGSYAIWVDSVRPPGTRFEAWRTHVTDELPAKTVFVGLGGALGPDDGVAASDPDGPDRVVSIETIDDPGNLTRVGVTVSEYLSEWSDEGRPIGVCFDSLTTLLQYADVQQVFRFVHELSRLMYEVDGVAHYHLNPGAHDDREINTLKTAFDAVVEVEDGELSITKR